MRSEREAIPVERKWIDILVVGLLAFVLYIPTLRFGLVNVDDPWLIKDNMLLKQPLGSSVALIWFDLSDSVRQLLGGEYLPIRDLSVMADYALWGESWGGHHFTNVCLYALLSMALVLSLKTWIRNRALALVASLLFVLHPIHVESVAWLSERKGLLSALFLFCATLTFHRFARHRQGLGMLVATALLMVASMWSKGLGVAGLGLLAVLLVLFPPADVGDGEISSQRRRWLGFIVVVLACALAFIPLYIAGKQVGMVSPVFHGGGFWSSVWLMARVHATYLLQLFFIGGYAIDYAILPGEVDLIRGLGGLVFFLILVIGALVGLWRYGRQSGLSEDGSSFGKILTLAACIWLIFLAPVSQLLFPLQNYMADRYLFLPSLAWSLAIGAFIQRLRVILFRRIVLAAVAAVALGITLFQIPSWASSKALYLQALDLNPKSIEALVQLARIDAEEGNRERSLQLLKRAQVIAPNDPHVLMRLALFKLEEGDRQTAIQVLRTVIARTSDDKARSNLALLLLREGQNKEALDLARAAVAYRPFRAHNQRVLGLAALAVGALDEALAAFREALRYEPFNPQNLINLSIVLDRKGDHGKAHELRVKAQTLGK